MNWCRSIRRLAWGGLLATAGVSVAACTPFLDGDASDDGSGVPPNVPETGPPSVAQAESTCSPAAPFQAPVLVAGLANVAMNVGGLRLSPDLLTGYFYADGRSDSAGGFDLYMAARDSPTSPFGGVQSLGSGVNTTYDELDPTVSEDGNELVFSRSQMGAGVNPSGLYDATRIAALSLPFTAAEPLGGTFVAADDSSPFLNPDATILYLSSFRGSGNFELFTASAEDAGFDGPVLLPGTVDIANYDQVEPVVTPDALTIYYASNRSDGDALGGWDVWAATRPSTSEGFSAPFDVRAVNSEEAEFPTFVTSDGCTLYLSSTRGGTLAMYVAVKSPP